MELFKFNYTTDPTVLERGELINGATSIMWVERYREAGEFEIVAPLSSGLLSFLPIGTLISHADSMEVMIVENQEIDEEKIEDPVITFTGRTLETFLEQRIIGTNQARASSTITEYSLAADYTWNQAVKLINDHIQNTTNVNDQLVNVVATTTVTGTGPRTLQVLKRDEVYKALLEILETDDLGIRTIRRSTFPGGDNTRTQFSIFRGVNRSNQVIFSWKAGDLSEVNYLWSDKKSKTSAMVVGRYINVMVDGTSTKYNKRTMIVDADDIDGNLSAPPSGAALTDVINKMIARGNSAISAKNRVTISRADISNISKYQYRKDFNVGDLVTLDGNFGQIAIMRVTEYVEIEDETGESAHPTLSMPDAGGSGFKEA